MSGASTKLNRSERARLAKAKSPWRHGLGPLSKEGEAEWARRQVEHDAKRGNKP